MSVTNSPQGDDVGVHKAALARLLEVGSSLAACQGFLLSTEDADLAPRLNAMLADLDDLIDEVMSRQELANRCHSVPKAAP